MDAVDAMDGLDAVDVLVQGPVAPARPVKVARVVLPTLTALWAAAMVGFGWLAHELGSVVYADGDFDRGAAFAQFGAGFAAVLCAGPTLLWLVVTLGFRNRRRWAVAVGGVAAALTGPFSCLVLTFGGLLLGGGLVGIPVVLLVNGLGVAAVMALVAARTGATSSAPQSG